jgi:serine/threonine protein kinase
MPDGREPRCQLAIQPMTGACFSILIANVVFMLTDDKRHHFFPFVKVFCRKKGIVGRPSGAKLTQSMSEQLRMVTCGWCETKVFIPGDLQPLGTVPCTKCGHPIMMPMMLRQFELRSIIGSGGMGTVYRAWDTTLERMVAVKLMKKELLQDTKALEAFYREARACARLNHTNIVHIYTFDEWDGQQYLVMELADRGSLDARIEKLRLLPELDVLDIGIKIASALDMALKYDLLHRDIKPGNILFNADHEPKLIDFGLARKADVEHEVEDVTWGTPYYVAPEKIKREPETFLSDMYSLGATLYHAMTGHVPFDAPTIEEVIVAQVKHPADAAKSGRARNHPTGKRCAGKSAGQESGRPLFELR